MDNIYLISNMSACARRVQETRTSHANDNLNAALCPLTLKPLPEAGERVGYVYGCANPFREGEDVGCGHRHSLSALVRHVGEGSTPICPLCNSTPILSICDGIAASKDGRKGSSLVCFRYSRQNYYLSVPKRTGSSGMFSFFFSNPDATAQERVAQVLDVRDGFKILQRGKVIYPNSSASAAVISGQLIELSNAGRDNKPSLVVMGTRAGTELREAGDNFSPLWSRIGIVRWGISFLRNAARGARDLLGGLFLFTKTLFILPGREGAAHRD